MFKLCILKLHALRFLLEFHNCNFIMCSHLVFIIIFVSVFFVLFAFTLSTITAIKIKVRCQQLLSPRVQTWHKSHYSHLISQNNFFALMKKKQNKQKTNKNHKTPTTIYL